MNSRNLCLGVRPLSEESWRTLPVSPRICSPCTTRRVEEAVAVAALVAVDIMSAGDMEGDSDAPSSGHPTRKIRQWLSKAMHRGPLGRQQNKQPMAPFAKVSARAISFTLPDAKGPTVLEQVTASAIECAERAKRGGSAEGPSRFLDASLVALLLRRNQPKTETFEQLSAAPVERALDSILADETIRSMPAHLIAPIADVGRASADVFDQVTPERRLLWTRALCLALAQEYPQPWVGKTPIFTLLCVGAETEQVKAAALVAFLRTPPRDGFQAMAAMAILRAMYMAADRGGFASSTVPFIARANNHYLKHLLELTGRVYVDWGAAKPKHQGAGLTGYHAPSPIDASWMQPGTITCHLYQPSPTSRWVARDLAYGNPYGAGISGSTNIFIFAAAHFNALGATQVDLVAMATAMAAMLSYNGGHSAREAYAAAQLFPESASTSLSALSGLPPGHARGFFIDQVDPGGTWLATASLERLVAFLPKLTHVA